MAAAIPETLTPASIIDTSREPVASGPFKPTWESLEDYHAPDWFRNAKFGIWAHWGPQCQPEDGDWYARNMYSQGNGQYKSHLEHYGHPSKSGFKDVIHDWKAEKWNPDQLVAFYKRAGARYFFAMANHHDNLDLWDSKYQPWNSVRVGPGKDLIAGWAAAARKNGLPLGLSVHAAHAWTWYETAQGADKTGAHAGVPYDGKLTKADGAGQWWEGLDPQDLYAQNHSLSRGGMNDLWNWGAGASTPDAAYCEKFYNRTMDLINRYQPDLLYFDDTALPLWPVSDAGLKIAAHFYNRNLQAHAGALNAVLFGKVLTEPQKKAVVWDVERGVPNQIQALPWQTDTCIGGWHYSRAIYNKNGYKSAKTVVHMMADIVSKNGNLLLNIPVRGDGSIDEKETAIVEEIGAWMKVNGEAIYDTRPWKRFGEGPASEGAAINAQGFNEGKGKPFTAADVRYTQKGDVLYVIVLGRPTTPLKLGALGKTAALLDRAIAGVQLVGSTESVHWNRTDAELVIDAPSAVPTTEACAFKITLAR
ncbi:MAG: alpha-L-fucosidase [Verrucomicrobia bacterium]|nr:alpha-L-fucosidase [Verrucomicrobiota bacterium]